MGELLDKFKENNYNKGLNDAWTLVNKIKNMSMDKRNKIFGARFTEDVLSAYTGQEALAKLEAYEKEQAEIKVGDVVIPKVGKYRQNEKGVVIGLYDKDDLLRIYVIHKDSNGNIDNTYYHKESLTKTGKHIDLQTILEQIAGD